MDVLIEGVGAVGGVLAAEVIAAGGRVTLVTGNPAITSAICADGLRLTTPARAFTVPAQVCTELDELPGGRRFDTCWLTMKANTVVDAARRTLAWRAPAGSVVAFQNGLVHAILDGVVPRSHLVCASVAFGATMEAPGVYRRTTRQSAIHLGAVDALLATQLAPLARVLEAVVPVTVTANIEGVLWGKLAWNCAVSGLCALGACTLGDLVATESGQALFLRVYTEVLDTAACRGVQVERAVVDHARLHCPPGLGAADYAARRDAVAALAEAYGDVRPSIVQSLARRRPTEIAWLNGEVVRQAARSGLPVPVNAAITAMVQAIERGERAVGMSNLDQLHHATGGDRLPRRG